MSARAAMFACCVTLCAVLASAGEPRPAREADPASAPPTSLLVLLPGETMDATYLKELGDAGHRVTVVSYKNRLTAEYVRQFGAVLIADLPSDGEIYRVGGEIYVNLDHNLDLLHAYVQEGGGLILQHSMSEWGMSLAKVFNEAVARYDVRILPLLVRHSASTVGTYAAGRLSDTHPVTKGLGAFLYPINVLRWDNACATVPFTIGKDWAVLANALPGATNHEPVNNKDVGPALGSATTIAAIRPAGKGFVAVIGIHSFYTITHAYHKASHIGESDTGVIDGIVLNGEKEGRPSAFGAMLDRLYRYMGANATRHGLGGAEVALPEQEPDPECTPVIDWNNATPPPTWRHRVRRTRGADGQRYYEELEDPLVQGEIRHFRALVGARTALSSGSGTVQDYRKAAIAAGYSAIFFAETFEAIDKAKWEYLVRDCENNSDETFVCVPGLDMAGFQGERYLLLGISEFPKTSWLTPDGKKLYAMRMLSLGWYGHVATAHRPGQSPLDPRMLKQYQGISVATYDRQGTLVDNGLHAYQWAVRSDSNPIPITAHECESPDDVARAAQSGFQQILPAPTVKQAVHYFRFAHHHYFDCPLRYYISEGPVLDGWSILNKDIGRPQDGRDRFRIGLGVTHGAPITEATLYDGFGIAARWRPAAEAFRATYDGVHDMQHAFTLIAQDASGRRVLSPGIRTVTRNWRLRCGDRQNWLGGMFIYTGWSTNSVPTYNLPLRHTAEGATTWIKGSGATPPVFDYPFFSNHVQITDIDFSTKYYNVTLDEIAGDGKGTGAVRPADYVEGRVRAFALNPPKGKYTPVVLETEIRLKRTVEPEPAALAGVFPQLASITSDNGLLILPGSEPAKLAQVYDAEKKKLIPGDAANRVVDLPAGSYAGGFITLTDGLRVSGRVLGFTPPSRDTLTLPEGTTWKARVILMKTGRAYWKEMRNSYGDIDPVAERLLTEMGLRGQAPFVFALTRGTLDRHAYIADCTARDGGIAGTCTNAKGGALLLDVPLAITGLHDRVAAAVWRADRETLDWFGVFDGVGHVAFNADRTVEFFAGNVVSTDGALSVQPILWNKETARFRVINPTARAITAPFATAPEIRGFKAVSREITVPAGAEIEVNE